MTDKYKNYSREDLISEIENLKKRKKFGLVWEVNPEEEIERLKNEAPYLIENSDRAIISDLDKPTNLLIEGDNYHALSMLNYTHKEKIDVIYIDPPYNTGARDWKYNNDYVDAEDSFRHSKWINMMYERLKLAKNLLSEDGILICAIDHNELANLKLILDDIFPNYTNEIIAINHNPAGTGGDNVSMVHEYSIVSVPKGKKMLKGTSIEGDREWGLKKTGAGKDYYRIGRPNMFFAVHVDKNTGIAVDVGPNLQINDTYPIKDTTEGYKRVYPLGKNGEERRWRYNRDTMLDLIKSKRVYGSTKSFSLKVLVKSDQKNRPVYSLWSDKKYNAGVYGTNLLNQIIDVNFPFPKPVNNVKDFIEYSTKTKKGATILDFFAGSGTTGHAVLEMNKQDGGNRKFILCTNNENNIAEEVTYERMKKVIEGYTGINDKKEYECLGGNLRYFKTEFVPYQNTDAHIKIYSNHFTELIKIKEGTFETYSKKDEIEIYENRNKYVVIIFDEMKIEEAKKILKELNKDVVIYIYSLTDDDFEDDFEDILENIPVISFPVSLLKK